MEIIGKIDFMLNERRRTTTIEKKKADRTLKLDKSRDAVPELYNDIIKYMSTYLNSLSNQELQPYKIINRQKAEELVTNIASYSPEAQAVLDKMHLDPEKFVAKYWTIKDMKVTLQDAVEILLKGKAATEEK